MDSNQKFTIANCFNNIADMRSELNNGGPYWLKAKIRKWIDYAKQIRLAK